MSRRQAVVTGGSALLSAGIYAAWGDREFFGRRFKLKSVGDELYYERVLGKPRTLLFQAHAWSSNKDECLHESTTPLAGIEDCVWICSDFGGPNNHPEGANHPAQMERIKRVIDATVLAYSTERIVLCGVSGGAGTALYMLGYFPGMFAAASVWCGYHDLAKWYKDTPGKSYPPMMDACFGGSPSGREGEYLRRSPKGILTNAKHAIVFLNHGNRDADILPIHTINAHEQIVDLPGVDSRLNLFSGGHVIDYPIAASQLISAISA